MALCVVGAVPENAALNQNQWESLDIDLGHLSTIARDVCLMTHAGNPHPPHGPTQRLLLPTQVSVLAAIQHAYCLGSQFVAVFDVRYGTPSASLLVRLCSELKRNPRIVCAGVVPRRRGRVGEVVERIGTLHSSGSFPRATDAVVFRVPSGVRRLTMWMAAPPPADAMLADAPAYLLSRLAEIGSIPSCVTLPGSQSATRSRCSQCAPFQRALEHKMELQGVARVVAINEQRVQPEKKEGESSEEECFVSEIPYCMRPCPHVCKV